MSFRDDRQAALARNEILERENRELIAENTRLRKASSPHTVAKLSAARREDHEAVVAHLHRLEMQKGRLIAENAKLRAGAAPPPAEPPQRPWPLNKEATPRDHIPGTEVTPAGLVVLVIVALAAAILGSFLDGHN
jgi:hypothetical protein